MTPSENAGTHQKAKGKENRGMCPLSGQKLASLCLGALSACWNCQWNSHRCRWVCVKTYWSFWSRLSLWWQIMATQLSNTSSLLAERTGAIFSFSGWTKSLMWLIWIGKEGGKKTSAQEWVRVPWIALQPGPWVCHARCLWGARCRRRWWCTGGGGGGSTGHKLVMGSREMGTAGHPPSGQGGWGGKRTRSLGNRLENEPSSIHPREETWSANTRGQYLCGQVCPQESVCPVGRWPCIHCLLGGNSVRTVGTHTKVSS